MKLNTLPLYLPLLLASAVGTNNAIAQDSTGNVISFAVESSERVVNDQAFAVLNKTVQAKDAATLAKKVNPLINQAMAIAKKYPAIQVTTGQPSAYPSYDDKGNITGMTAQARLNLSTQNTEQLSALIGELQGMLVLEQMYFDVSDATSEQIKQQLMLSTSKKFQAQAAQITKAWGAKNYKLLQVNLDNQNSTPHHYPMAMSAKYADTAPILEAGDSKITYRINGSIALIY